jgi:hypothetical protein
MPEPIVVGGRRFAPVDPDALSARRDDWIQVRILEAGLDALPNMFARGEDAAREILLRALKSGAKPRLLAGMFDELAADGAPIPWTPDRAEVLAEYFACLTSRDDREAVNGAFLGVLVSFFRPALGSSASSATSSSPSAGNPSAPSAPSPASPASTSSSVATPAGTTTRSSARARGARSRSAPNP